VVEKTKPRQTRDGRDLDAFRSRAAIKQVAEAAKDATPAQMRRVAAVLDEAQAELRHDPKRPAAHTVQARTLMPYTLRSSLHAVILARHTEGRLDAAQAMKFLDSLVDLEAEIAFHRRSVGDGYHIASVLSLRCIRVAAEALFDEDDIAEWIAARAADYRDMYWKEVVGAWEDGGAVEVPRLITGRMLGEKHRITCAEMKAIFPKGRHGIRGYDRDRFPYTTVTASRIGLTGRRSARPRPRRKPPTSKRTKRWSSSTSGRRRR
jgi:hypothetical protein